MPPRRASPSASSTTLAPLIASDLDAGAIDRGLDVRREGATDGQERHIAAAPKLSEQTHDRGRLDLGPFRVQHHLAARVVFPDDDVGPGLARDPDEVAADPFAEKQGFELVAAKPADEAEGRVGSPERGQHLRDVDPLAAGKPVFLDDAVRDIAGEAVDVNRPVEGGVERERVDHGHGRCRIGNGGYQGFGESPGRD